MSDDTNGFSWSGDLARIPVRVVYGTCQSLRFSGWLELKDGPTRATVLWVGGEPVDIVGGDTQRIALWLKGSFEAVQWLPNIAGEMSQSRETNGTLGQVAAPTLWTWASDYRLTCEIQFDKPGTRATVVFVNGHAE